MVVRVLKGRLIDPGLDLNMNVMARHVKQAIILTAIPQILLVSSNYFWLAPFIALLKVLWIVWKYIIAPKLGYEYPA